MSVFDTIKQKTNPAAATKKTADEVDDNKPVEKIRDSKFHNDVSPRNGYVYYGDYFTIDDKAYGCVLTVLHDDGADDRLAPFWGLTLSLIDAGEGLEDVSVRFINQVSRREKSWVESKIDTNEIVVESNSSELKGANRGSKEKAADNSSSFTEVSQELNKGASYLDVRLNYLVKAPSLELLDEAIRKINYKLRTTFDTIRVVAKDATQRFEFTHLLRANETKPERAFGFTSDEFGGFSNLVTQGINDLTGQYIGKMTGDVNNSAVVFDVNDYKHSVVIASSAKAHTLTLTPEEIAPNGGARGSDMWGVKLAQETLKEGGRVVEFVLNDADVMSIGFDLSKITALVSMSDGDVNPFEVFGTLEDEIGQMAVTTEKLVLMISLVGEMTDSPNKARLKGELASLIPDFYRAHNMWVANVTDSRQRDAVRLVCLPHEEYPLLHHFNVYVAQRHHELLTATHNDPKALEVLGELQGIIKQMLVNNGDLFDNHTRSTIDAIRDLPRVVYDFNSLSDRGEGVAMAQFANVLSFAVRTLGEGDTVIFHGAEHITKEMRDYVGKQIENMYSRRIRVVFVYDSVSAAIKDFDFNDLIKADYTLFGAMDSQEIEEYQKRMRVTINDALADVLMDDKDYMWFLRRSFQNVVFGCDVCIGRRIPNTSTVFQ